MSQTTQSGTAHDHFKAGRLNDAIAAAAAQVKAAPTDGRARFFLAELLCFRGEFERADMHFDALSRQDTDLAVTVALIRQIVRSEEKRQQFHRDGRAPEFIGEPSASLRARVEASVCLRQGDVDGAKRLLEEANAREFRAAGSRDELANAVEFRDLDDLTCGVIEACTSNGKFYWIDLAEIESIQFDAAHRPIDVLWRAAKIDLREGPEIQIYMPSIYAVRSEDEQIALGRATTWNDIGGLVRGAGHRMFLLGEEAKPAVELKSLFLTNA